MNARDKPFVQFGTTADDSDVTRATISVSFIFAYGSVKRQSDAKHTRLLGLQSRLSEKPSRECNATLAVDFLESVRKRVLGLTGCAVHCSPLCEDGSFEVEVRTKPEMPLHWTVRTVGIAILGSFYHDPKVSHLLVTHENHCQKISRDGSGWVPCDYAELASSDAASCHKCICLEEHFTGTERLRYYKTEILPRVLAYYSGANRSLPEQAKEPHGQTPCPRCRWFLRCLSDTDEPKTSETLAYIRKCFGWILRGFPERPHDEMIPTLRTMCCSPKIFGGTLAFSEMYKLTDCQNESRGQMFECYMNEQHLTSVYLLRGWLDWVEKE